MKDESKGAKPTRRPSSNKTAKKTTKQPAPRSEFDFINHLRRQLLKQQGLRPNNTSDSSFRLHPSSFSSLIAGIGDDAAVTRPGSAAMDSLVTADLLVEDIDFRRASAPPRLLGHKALAVSLSDIAATGARPRWALLSVGIPDSIWKSSFLEEFYEGFRALAEAHRVTLIGGDVSRTPDRIVVDSIVLGEARRGRALLRSGARPGDRIFVTGSLGGAAAGLQLLESGERLSANVVRRLSARGDASNKSADTSTPLRAPSRQRNARRRLLLRHLRPDARVSCGWMLGERRLATSSIDLSDGLSSDLAHLCRESRVGASIEAALIPVDTDIEEARLKDADPLAYALDGGEDYELLFTVSPRRAARLPEIFDGVRFTEIGEVTDEAGRITLLEQGRKRVLRPRGFVHFKGAR